MEDAKTTTNSNTTAATAEVVKADVGSMPTVSAPVPDMSAVLFDDRKFERMHDLAQLMASGKCAIPKHLQNNPSDCFAVIMQSMQWGMNPFAVAQKTHVVNGALGYEAQLVNAVVTATSAISGRFHYEYTGDWDAYRASGFNKQKEAGCGVNVGAVIRGETEVRWLPSPLFMETVKTRNSPLWASNPQQQLAYLGVKYWARLYTPDAILGVYSDDELDSGSIDVTPVDPAVKKPAKSKTEKLAEKLGATATVVETKAEAVEENAIDGAEIVRRIEAALKETGAPVTLADCETWLRGKRLLKTGQTLAADFAGMKRDWIDYIACNTRDFVLKVADDVVKEG